MSLGACGGCVAQLVEQRSPKSPVGGSNPSALDENLTQERCYVLYGCKVKSAAAFD